MTSKRKKDELNARRDKQKLRKLARDGRMANGVEMPRGGIAADISKQAPGSRSHRNYYHDIEFTCVDCGKSEVWRAKDQKWYFEVVKGPIQGEPKRCRDCRKKFRAMKVEQRIRMEAAERTRRERKTRD